MTKTEIAQRAVVSSDQTWLLSYGDTGEAVAAVQRELRIIDDGIFGPQTEGALKEFQRGQGLAATGAVDAKTWTALFNANVVFYDDDAAAASSGETVLTSAGSETEAAEPAPAPVSEPDAAGDDGSAPAPRAHRPRARRATGRSGAGGAGLDGWRRLQHRREHRHPGERWHGHRQLR